MLIETEKYKQINSKLLNWFDNNKRDLIFRLDKDPYKVWISEIMAQQTQIDTLLPYFKRFIERFPTLRDLSEANEEEVLKLWEGLGYYSRARNILKAAKLLKNKDFPTQYSEIIKLPGIGPYTAGAISSICFNEKIPAIDGNVIRVLSRIYDIEINLNQQKNKNLLWQELKQTMPEQAGNYNESLMELGALICKPKNPSCLICPVREFCSAFKLGKTDILPVKNNKKENKEIQNIAFILFEESEPSFIKRTEESLLNNLYGLPIFNTENEESILTFIENNNLNDIKELGNSIHKFTHITWNTRVFKANVSKLPVGFVKNPGSIPTAFKKMLQLLESDSES